MAQGGQTEDGVKEERKLFTITKFTGTNAALTFLAAKSVNLFFAGTVFWSHKKENET
jgi:hypothetical protein